jgi:MSHA biogenesis protein MshK
MTRLIKASLVAATFALLLAQINATGAEILPDPTKPPASALGPGEAEQSAQGPVLQSVLITPTRRSAIISGQLVVQGGRYGDANVIRISDSEVVLKTGDMVETLKLFPGVEKRLVQPPQPPGSAPARTRKPVRRPPP